MLSHLTNIRALGPTLTRVHYILIRIESKIREENDRFLQQQQTATKQKHDSHKNNKRTEQQKMVTSG